MQPSSQYSFRFRPSRAFSKHLTRCSKRRKKLARNNWKLHNSHKWETQQAARSPSLSLSPLFRSHTLSLSPTIPCSPNDSPTVFLAATTTAINQTHSTSRRTRARTDTPAAWRHSTHNAYPIVAESIGILWECCLLLWQISLIFTGYFIWALWQFFYAFFFSHFLPHFCKHFFLIFFCQTPAPWPLGQHTHRQSCVAACVCAWVCMCVCVCGWLGGCDYYYHDYYAQIAKFRGKSHVW